MTLAVEMITFDCAEPDRLADWWAEAVDGNVSPWHPANSWWYHAPKGPGSVSSGSTTRRPARTGCTLTSPPRTSRQEVNRLVTFGATETGRHELGSEFRWVVMADPDGNAFCVGAGG